MSKKKLRIVPRLNLASEEDKDSVASDGITLEDTGVDATPQGKAPKSAEGSEGAEYLEEGEGTQINIEVEPDEEKAVSAALSLLASKGVKSIKLAGKKAHFFQVENPDAPPNFEQIAQQTRSTYRGKGKSLSDNDAFFFTPPADFPGSKIAGTVHMPMGELATIVRNATEAGARNAVDVVFSVLREAGYDLRPMKAKAQRQAGLADNFGKAGRTNIQAEIEDSHPPTRGMVDSVEFDKVNPKALKGLEFVADLPFDEIDSAPKVEHGRKIGPNAIPNKVVK